MSLTLALNNALSGLRLNQQALALTSHNLSNANVEGYSRQEIDSSARYTGGQLNGVQIDGISRKVDTYLQSSIRTYSAVAGRTEAISEYMDRMQIILGEPGDVNSLDEYMTSFFNDLQNLAETPERSSFRESTVNSGVSLAREISTLADSLEQFRYDADIDIKNSVVRVNDILESISSLNIAINNAVALGNSTAGFEDQRDLLLEELSEYLSVDTYVLDTGEMHIYTRNGTSLLDDRVYSLSYENVESKETFIDDGEIHNLEVVVVDINGQIVSTQGDLIGSGVEGDITSTLREGRIEGLRELRDVILPQTLAQVDELAATIRDVFNAIHNDGSSYPGADELTGDRLLSAGDKTEWSGGLMIAVLNEDGTPAFSRYDDEQYTGTRPLNLDLTFLDSGFGTGYPTTQTIIDEINNHFGPAPIKTSLGNLNNIQLVSDINAMPDVPPIFSFDFDLENISNLPADFFVTGMTVLDDGGVDITSINTPPPEVTLDAVNTFNTVNGSVDVIVNASSHGLAEGQRIYINDPAVAINGITGAAMQGFYEVTNVTNNSFQIQVSTAATATGGVSVASQTSSVAWDTVEAGDERRIRDAGVVELDLLGNAGSSYYDITFNMAVDDGAGAVSDIKVSQVTYRIHNNKTALLNDRYNSTAELGDAERIAPNTSTEYLIAKMVDENGVELLKNNGVYTSNKQGFLKLETSDGLKLVIESQDSKQLGVINQTPTEEGTGRGFSHYFGLNNFFQNNGQTLTGDVLTGSAINLQVDDRFLGNANLISLGHLEQSNQPVGEDAKALYTYERYISNNEIVQQLAGLKNESITFAAAGGLGLTTQDFIGYISDILANNSAQSASAFSDNKNANILLQGFAERADSFSGVNVDEEMANTILYQQAYNASARIISVSSEMFDSLLSAI